MELYQIIATCNNYTGAGNPRTLLFIPENFKGVKITQKFSKVNPLGYTPSFSVETMRAIDEDKDWLDAIFDLYGLESSVTFDIKKLNATATSYVLKSTFAVDFESYEKLNYFSEFALKSISCIDQYNKIKNSPKDFTGALSLSTPTTQKFVNYISVKKTNGVSHIEDSELAINTGYLELEENNDSKVYNNDFATYGGDQTLYQFDRGVDGVTNMAELTSGNLLINFDWAGSSAIISVRCYKNDFSTPVFTIASREVNYGSSVAIEFNNEKTRTSNFSFEQGDYLFIGIEVNDPNFEITGIFGEFSIDLWVETEVNANEYGRKVKYLTSKTILDSIFDGQNSTETSLEGVGITSAQALIKRLNYISLTPKDFITDFCLATGSLVNFKNDGTVDIAKISTYFTALLQKSNAITVTDFKDFKIGYDTTLNYASVSVGMEQKEYEVYSYLNDWNKILTFSQFEREASEELNLAMTKFRVDYSGILDFINKMSSSSTDTSTDMFFFDPTFAGRSTFEGIVYDIFTPRDILENWRKFLEFCFYNFGKNTLVLSSNSGDDYNLQIAGVNQMDPMVLSGTNPKILPLTAELTCLITDTDFTSKILNVVYEGEEIYIFVTEAQTTDNLDEQKIKGNLIQFPS